LPSPGAPVKPVGGFEAFVKMSFEKISPRIVKTMAINLVLVVCLIILFNYFVSKIKK
jgi:hypothetical protein